MNKRGFLTEADRVDHFLTLLRTESNDENYQRCLDQLDDYITAQLNGEPYLDQFADIAVLLDAHPECAEAYALLYALITADQTQTLAPSPHTPPPDLRFLGEKTPSLLTQLTSALQQTASTITFTLTEALLAALRPPSATITPALRTAQSERYGEQLLQLEPNHAPPLHIPFILKAYHDSQQPDHSLIEITVQPPGKSWPELSDYQVNLHYNNQSQQATTDAWGVVSFLDIPTAQLTTLVITINLSP